MGARIVTWVWFALAGTLPAGGSAALEALRVLESALGSGVSGKVIALAGFDGDDQPQAWRVLVKDDASPEVLQEYIVTGGKLTARNAIPRAGSSDLPEKPLLAPPAAWRIDSPEAYRIADDEAILAGLSFSRLHYQLRFRGADRSPTWLLTFVDAGGAEVGQVVIDSSDGAIAFRNFPPAATPPAGGEPPVPVSAREPVYASKPLRLRDLFSGVRGRRAERSREAPAKPENQGAAGAVSGQ